MSLTTTTVDDRREKQTKHNFYDTLIGKLSRYSPAHRLCFITFRRRSYPLKSEVDKPIRFSVRSLGWVEIAEEDLTPERSSKAVNKCILDLSFGKNDLLDVIGRWGDVSVEIEEMCIMLFGYDIFPPFLRSHVRNSLQGKDLFLDLDEGALKLIDPENLTVLNAQPIHTIRVWGVGRDNGR